MTGYQPLPAPDGPAVRELLAALRATHTNGGALLARLRAVDPAERWFTFTSFLDLDQDVQDLFDSAAARSVLAELALPQLWPIGAPPRFTWGTDGALTLDGELAGVLGRGGAYARYPGTAAQAKALAARAVGEVWQDRFGDLSVFHGPDAWTPWFYGVAWDRTWVVVDRARHEVTVLCVTDTD